MTTILPEPKKCALCGKTSEYMLISSTNTFGSPDLDTRPPEMQRSTIQWWVQTCPSCGYCSPDISEAHGGASETVRTPAYQTQLNDKRYPRLANAFLCFGLIQESAGKHVQAGWANIHAAWACDDAGSEIPAAESRKKALILLRKAKELGQAFAMQPGAEEAIIADLARRSGQLELAREACDRGLRATGLEATVEAVLRFEAALTDRGDTGRHTIAEALGES